VKFALFFLALAPGVCLGSGIYKWVDENGKVRFSDKAPVTAPPGGVETVREKQQPLDRVETERPYKQTFSLIPIPELGVAIEDIQTRWSTSTGSSPDQRIMLPELLLRVRNTSDATITRLTLSAMFEEQGNKIVGRDEATTLDLPVGYQSTTLFFSPTVGIILNPYNRATIMEKTYTIKLSVNNGRTTVDTPPILFDTREY
jgi:hypothetical protein